MSQTQTRRWLDWTEWALVGLGVVAYLFLPHGIGADGTARYQTIEQLRLGHISPARYSIVQSILALPLYIAGELIDYPFGLTALFNTMVLVAGLAAIAVLLRPRIAEPLLRRMLLLLLAASMFGNHVQVFYGEVLTAVCVAVGLLCLITGRALAGHALLIIGVVNTPVALPAMFLALLVTVRRNRLWHALWPTGIAAVLVMTEFYVRRGSPFLTGYEGDGGHPLGVLPYSNASGFGYPFAFGVLAILFSFGKGILLFIPGLGLIFKRTIDPPPDALQQFQRGAVWFLVGLIAVYAKWWSWNGSWFWGPRFFLFGCFPASVALAMHLCDARATPRVKAITLAVLGWSIWVGINGAAIGLSGLEICRDNGYRFEFLCWYTVEYSALFRPFTVFPAVPLREASVAVYFVLVGVVLAAPFTLDLVRAAGALTREWRRGTSPA